MIWIIKGKDLPTLEIIADSFDEALAIARKDNQDYVSGQVKESHYKLSYRHNGEKEGKYGILPLLLL